MLEKSNSHYTQTFQQKNLELYTQLLYFLLLIENHTLNANTNFVPLLSSFFNIPCDSILITNDKYASKSIHFGRFEV